MEMRRVSSQWPKAKRTKHSGRCGYRHNQQWSRSQPLTLATNQIKGIAGRRMILRGQNAQTRQPTAKEVMQLVDVKAARRRGPLSFPESHSETPNQFTFSYSDIVPNRSIAINRVNEPKPIVSLQRQLSHHWREAETSAWGGIFGDSCDASGRAR